MRKVADEKVVKVKVKLDSTETALVFRWVIMDEEMGYYRTESPLESNNAWHKSVSMAQWFLTRKAAKTAYRLMLEERKAIRESKMA